MKRKSNNKQNFNGRGSKKKPMPKVAKNNLQDRFAIDEKEKGRKSELDDKFCGRPISRVVDKDNDANWYFKDRNTLEAVASFSYLKPLGSIFDYQGTIQVPPNYEGVHRPLLQSGRYAAIPGVMALTLAITPGFSADAQSPVNLAAQNLYSFVRYKNSGAANYDAPDLMMYCLALDSLYACWNWMKRIYGYSSTYSQTNKYRPQAYAKLENIDLDDIYVHLADFRAYLNMAASRISSFAAPAVFTYFVRHSWLFSNIYKDADTIKAQEYMYTPDYFYQFQETAVSSGTSLSPAMAAVNSETPWGFQELTTYMNTLINSMQYSEDAGIMSGDIMKAFGSDLFTLSTFDADYKIEPVYSKEVLMQIENATIIPFTALDIVNDVDTNYIQCAPSVELDHIYQLPTEAVINFHMSDPTAEDMMVASRLTNVYSIAQDGKGWTITSFGSEVAVDCRVALYAFGTEDSTPFDPTKQMSIYIIPINGKVSWLGQGKPRGDVLWVLWCWEAFDWAPSIVASAVVGQTPGTPWDADAATYITAPFRDYDVFTTLSRSNVQSMHLLALLSEFNVPN